MGRSRLASAAIIIAGAVLAACSRGDAGAPDGAVLQARTGTYDDGSGRLGTALLITLRTRGGSPPASGATLALRDPAGEPVASFDWAEAAASTSYAVSWWPGIAPMTGTYEVVADIGTESLSARPQLATGDSLLPPAPGLSLDGAALEWPPVAGAASYACRVYASGALQAESTGAAPACDVSTLAPGPYAASVIALSVDLDALAADGSEAPPLPERFDVSEASFAFVRGTEEGATATLRSAGGAYDDAGGPPSLAIWTSLAGAGGAPVGEHWEVEVVGPGLPPDAPLAFTYPANFPRLVVWAPGVPAIPGTYSLTASSGSAAVAGRFTLGEVAPLGLPTSVDAQDGAQGAARVAWDATAGAASYLVTAYDAVTGAVAASQWTAGAPAEFPQGTFTPGRTYDVYVAACDADMVGGAVPEQFAVSENVFGPDSFVAR